MTSVEQTETDRIRAEFDTANEFFANLREETSAPSRTVEKRSQSEKVDDVVNKSQGEPIIRFVAKQKSDDSVKQEKLETVRGYLDDIGTVQTAFVKQKVQETKKTSLLYDTETWKTAYSAMPLLNVHSSAYTENTFNCKAIELSTELLTALVGFSVGAETVAAKAFNDLIKEFGKKIRLRQEKSGSVNALVIPSSRAVINEDTGGIEGWHNLYLLDAKHSREIISVDCGSVEMVNINVTKFQIESTFSYGMFTRYPWLKGDFEKWIYAHRNELLGGTSFGIDNVEKSKH